MGFKFNPFTGNLDEVGSPGGSTTQVQFNDAGAFAGDADLTWNKTTNVLGITGDVNLDDGVAGFTTTLQTITPTAARTISLPDATGTVALVAGSSGQVIYNNAGANAGITAGTTGQVLVSQAVGSVPVWGSALVSGTSVASTSGPSIDFFNIPSWVKRVTVMFNGVSTNGTSQQLVRLGTSSGVQTTGYISQWGVYGTPATASASSTAGFGVWNAVGTLVRYAHITLTVVSGNTWVSSHSGGLTDGASHYGISGGGAVTLSGTLDRVRITTDNGTDAFDAGSINILYE